jgi:hypothetical protein
MRPTRMELAFLACSSVAVACTVLVLNRSRLFGTGLASARSRRVAATLAPRAPAVPVGYRSESTRRPETCFLGGSLEARFFWWRF